MRQKSSLEFTFVDQPGQSLPTFVVLGFAKSRSCLQSAKIPSAHHPRAMARLASLCRWYMPLLAIQIEAFPLCVQYFTFACAGQVHFKVVSACARFADDQRILTFGNEFEGLLRFKNLRSDSFLHWKILCSAQKFHPQQFWC
jgi:hypothetical protein